MNRPMSWRGICEGGGRGGFRARRLSSDKYRFADLKVSPNSEFGSMPKLSPHQNREATKRRIVDEETLRSIAPSYNLGTATISRLSV